MFSNIFRKLPSRYILQINSYKNNICFYTNGKNSRRIWNNLFGKYLLATNIVSSGVLMCMGDIIQQEIEFQRDMLEKRYDWTRLGRMFMLGISGGPLTHYFYISLDKFLPQRTVTNTLKKIVLDQVIMSPIAIAWFFYGMALAEGRTLRDCHGELDKKFFLAYLFDCCLWPPTQFINFHYIPVKYQVLYINVITVFYNAFLSHLKHREQALETRRLRLRLNEMQ